MSRNTESQHRPDIAGVTDDDLAGIGEAITTPRLVTGRVSIAGAIARSGLDRLTKAAPVEDIRDALDALRADTIGQEWTNVDRAAVRMQAERVIRSCGISGARPLVAAILSADQTTQPTETGIALKDDEPASEPVNGADLLEDTAAVIRRYVVLHPHEADTCALYAGVAHAVEGISRMAMLLLTSPGPECGKTTAATIMAAVVPRPVMVSSLTAAVLFRLIAEYRPTLIADEVDSWLTDEKSEIRGVFNAAHWRSGAKIPRCVGDDHRIEFFDVFGPKIIAMIRKPHATMLSRSIVVSLKRRTGSEKIEHIQEENVIQEHVQLRRRWRRWAADHLGAMRAHRPAMPDDLPQNRASDNWRPLISLADLAGGDWPQRARIAALALSGVRLAGEDTTNVELLHDVRAVFNDEHKPSDRRQRHQLLSSEEIILGLKALSDRPWTDWNRGRGISTAQLASRLRDFGSSALGLRTRETRLGDRTGKRWHRDDFADAWRRYLAEDPQQPQQAAVDGPEPSNPKPQHDANVAAPEIAVQPVFTEVVADVAATNLKIDDADSGGDDADYFTV